MNTALLRKVARHITAEPKRLDMGEWATACRGRRAPSCGIVGCIGGWACILSAKGKTMRKRFDVAYEKVEEAWGPDFGEMARRALRLDEDQRNRLFFVDNWPEEFRVAYDNADWDNKHTAMARITKARIAHFIKTGGRE